MVEIKFIECSGCGMNTPIASIKRDSEKKPFCSKCIDTSDKSTVGSIPLEAKHAENFEKDDFGNPIPTAVNNSDLNHVVVTDIQMPFGSMIVFMVKWAFAAIPAVLVIMFVLMVVSKMLVGD